MGRKSIYAFFGLLIAAAAGLGSVQAQTTMYWDPTAGAPVIGGSGTWDTTVAAWSLTNSGDASLSTWGGSSSYNAEFYAGSGTVTLNNPQSVGNITFDAGTGYTINGSQLSISGSIIVNQNATIGSTIDPTLGLSMAGPATLSLPNGLTLSTGSLTLNGGTLSMPTTNSNGNVGVNGIATAYFNGGVLNAVSGIQVNSGGTLNAYFNGSATQVLGSNGLYARYGTVNLNVLSTGGSIAGNLSTNHGGTINVNLSNGGTLGANQYIQFGADSFNVSGSGALTLTNNLSMGNGGSLSVSGGTLNVPQVYNNSGSTSTVNLSGGLLNESAYAPIGGVMNINFNGGALIETNGIQVNSGGTLNATFNASSPVNVTGNGIYAYQGGVANLNVSSTGSVITGRLQTNSVATINVNLSNGGTLTATQYIQYGADTFNVGGSGALTVQNNLGMANGGKLNIGGGTLNIPEVYNSSGGTSTINLSGGLLSNNGSSPLTAGGVINLNFNGGVLNSTNGIQVNTGGTLNGVFNSNTPQTISSGNGFYAAGGVVNLAVPSTGATITGNLNTNFSTAQFNVLFSGGGTLNVSGYVNNWASGASYSLNGNGMLNDAGVLESQGNALGVSISGGAAFQAGSMTIYASDAINATLTGGTLNVLGNLSNSGTFTASLNAGDLLQVGGSLTGSGPVNLTGAGLVQVNGAGTGYSGNLAVNGGTLQLGSNAMLSAGAVTINSPSMLNITGGTIQTTGALNINSTASVSLASGGLFKTFDTSLGGGGVLNISGSGIFNQTDTGTIYMPGGGTAALNVSGGAYASFASGGFRVNNVGSATLNTSVSAGTLSLANLYMNPNGGANTAAFNATVGSGGLLIVPGIGGGNDESTLNISGGTIDSHTAGIALGGPVNINISNGGYLSAQYVTAGTGAAYGGTSNINVSSGTLSCTSYDFTVTGGATLNLATSAGGLANANRWIVNNNILNASLSGGTIQSGSTFTNSGTTSVSFSGGGLFQVGATVVNGGSQLNVSGPGFFITNSPSNGQYMPSSGVATISASGGAYVALPNGTISNVSPAELIANVSGGTMAINNLSMNPNNLATDFTQFVAGVGGGGLLTVATSSNGNGLYMNTGGSNGNGLISVSVSGGSTFNVGSAGIGSGNGGLLTFNLSGGTVQTNGTLSVNGTTSVSLTAGDLVQVNALSFGSSASQLNVSGPGTFVSTYNSGTEYISDGGTGAISVSNGASVSVKSTNLYVDNVHPSAISATVNGGTLSFASLGMNPNGGTYGAAFAANVSNGGLLYLPGGVGGGNSQLSLTTNGATITSTTASDIGVNGPNSFSIGGGGSLYARDINIGSSAALGSASMLNMSSGTLTTLYDVDVNSGAALTASVTGGALLQVGRNFNVSGGTLNAYFVNGGTIQANGGNGLYTYSGGATTLNVGSAGGTLLGSMNTNNGSKLNVVFSGGGTLNGVTSMNGWGVGDTWSLSGPGTLNNSGNFYAQALNVSVSGGASFGSATTEILNGNSLSATVNSGTLSLGNVSINQNSQPTGGTLTANLSNGGVLTTSTVHDSGIGASQVTATVGSGCLFTNSNDINMSAPSAFTAAISSGGTIQTGSLNGAGMDTINGAGMLLVTSNGNNHSGVLNLNGGTLQYGSATANATNTIGSLNGTINLAPAAVISITGTTSGDFAGDQAYAVSGSGTVYLTNAGASAANYSGGLSASFSGLAVTSNLNVIANANAYGSGTLQIATGHLLTLTTSGVYNYGIQMSGGTIQPFSATYGTTTFTASNSSTLAGPLVLTGNTVFDAGNVAMNVTIAGPISGGQQVQFGGQGNGGPRIFTLAPSNSTQNSYGGMVIAGYGNRVIAGNQYAFSGGPLTMAGDEIDLNGYNASFANLSGGGNFTNGGSNSVTATIGSDNTSTTFNGSITDTVTQISGTASLAIIKTGTGTLSLLYAVNNTGGIQVNQGVLQIGRYCAGNGPLSVANGATLDLNGWGYYDEAASSYSIIGSGQSGQGALVNNNTGKYEWMSSAITMSGNASIGGAGTLALQGQITDDGNSYALTVVGPGLVAFGNGNGMLYHGGTIVSGGTLQLQQGGVNALGPNHSAPLTLNGGVLDIDGQNQTVGAVTLTSGAMVNSSTTAATLTGTSYELQSGLVSAVLAGAGVSATKDTSGTVVLAAANTYGGGTTISAGTLQLGDGVSRNGSVTGNISVAVNAALAFANPNYQAYTGVINGSGSLVMNGPGLLAVQGVNTAFAGSTTINGGVLQMGNNNALGNDNGNLTLAVNSGTLDLNGNVNPTFAVLSGSGVVTNSNSGGYAIFNYDNSTTSSTFAGSINDGAGSVGLHVGSGTLTLAGQNNYSQSTTVDGGAALLLGSGASLSGPTPVKVSGLFGTALTNSGGTVNGGNTLTLYSGGVLNLQDGQYNTLAFAGSGAISSATLAFDIGAGTGHNDELTFGGALAPSGTLNFALDALGSLAAGRYTLITAASGGLSGLGSSYYASCPSTLSGSNVFLSSDANDLYVTIGATSTGPSVWASALSGSWSSGPWTTTSAPNAAAAGAVLNKATTSSLAITLDSAVTLGTLQLGNSASATTGYVLSGNSLTLNNSGSGATITVTDGTHVIDAPTVLADNLTVTGSNSGWTLGFGTTGGVTETGGPRTLTMSGNGTLVLSGSDGYSGGTIVEAGTLIATTNSALADGSSLTVGAGGVFIFDPMVSVAPTAIVGGMAMSGNVAAVPEPATVTLAVVGGLMLLGYGRWRRRSRETAPPKA